MHITTKYITLAAVVLLLAVLSGCGGGGGSAAPPSNRGNQPDPALPDPVPPAEFIFTLPTAKIANGVNYENAEFERNYGLGQIKVTAAYQRGFWGQNVTVAVVDSGMLTSHVDLRDNVVPGLNVVNPALQITDADGHGTFVAGIIGASRNNALNSTHGVAPSVSLMPLQIGEPDAGRLVGSTARAFRFAVSNNVHIVNNSYGSFPAQVEGIFEGERYFIEMPMFAPLWARNPSKIAEVYELEREIGDADSVFVWAAGNDGWQTGGTTFLCSDLAATSISGCGDSHRIAVGIAELRAKFNAEECGTRLCGTLGTIRITVAGTNITLGIPESGVDFYSLFPYIARNPQQMQNRWLAVVATESPRFTGDNRRNLWVGDPMVGEGSNGCGEAMFWCLAAPGENVYSTNVGGGYNGNYSGTSFSAPHVSGALALLKGRLPGMRMDVARALLLLSADDLGDPGIDADYGWGFVNVEMAMTMQGDFTLRNEAGLPASVNLNALSLALPPPNPENNRESFRTPEFMSNYGLNNIRADYAYSRGYFGQGVTVGVVDSGMLTSHVDLRDNVVAGCNFATGGNVCSTTITDPITSYNTIGHGTAVAGVIAAVRNNIANSAHGVAPQAKLMPLQIGDNVGRLIGNPPNAIRYAADRGVPILNNSYGGVFSFVGDYEGERYHLRLPNFGAFFNGPSRAPSIANEVGADMVLVWAAGNSGWRTGNRGVRLCKDIDLSIIGLERCPEAMRLTLTPQELIAGFVAVEYQRGLIATVSLRTGGTYEDVIRVSTRALGAFSALGLTTSGTGLNGRLPIAHPELLSHWLVVVATDKDDELASFSNGCGDTKFWCLAAPGVSITTTSGGTIAVTDSEYGRYNGTSFSAPYVSGALAVLKSRLPAMPMSAVRAILLHTAKDLGAAGVDDNFGWGLVDLEKAITLQGNVKIVLEENTANVNVANADGVRVMGTRINLPAGFASVREELAQISVAVSVFGNAHYNMPLGALVQVSPSVQTTLGNAAADMLAAADNYFEAGMFFAATDTQRFRYAGADLELQDFGAWRFQHNFCKECEESVWAEWNVANDADDITTPFFAQDKSAFVMQMRGKGLRPFAAFSGEIGDADSLPYRQFGLRWTGGNERISFAAEASEIRESDSFMGASFGALGETAAKTHQGKIIMRGALVGGWSGFASYERAHGEAEVADGGFLQSISGLRAWGWKAGLQRQDILFGGDKLRLSAGRQTSLRRGDAVFNFAQARCTDGTAGDCFNEAVFGDIEGAPDFYKERSQELTSKRAQVSLSSVSSLLLTAGYSARVWHSGEFSLGVEHDTGTKESAVSAQLQFAF